MSRKRKIFGLFVVFIAMSLNGFLWHYAVKDGEMYGDKTNLAIIIGWLTTLLLSITITYTLSLRIKGKSILDLPIIAFLIKRKVRKGT